MYWKVFHLGTALGNTLIGIKYSGQSLIQLTLQLASQLWLHIRTTWELRKKKKQLLPGPPPRTIESESGVCCKELDILTLIELYRDVHGLSSFSQRSFEFTQPTWR